MVRGVVAWAQPARMPWYTTTCLLQHPKAFIALGWEYELISTHSKRIGNPRHLASSTNAGNSTVSKHFHISRKT
eukprot:8953728-Pyramimonas_sp.AAC.1